MTASTVSVSTAPGRSTLLCALYILLLTQLCSGLPVFIVNSGRPRCMTVDAARHTKMRVYYEALDLESYEDGGAKGATYITVTEKPEKKLIDELDEMDALDRKKKHHRPPQPTSEQLHTKEGSFVHKVQENSEIYICVRAGAAGQNNPMRFGLRVAEEGDESADLAEESGIGKISPPADVDSHLTHMEREIDRIKNSLRVIVHEAEFFEERDGLFHKENLKMHSASLYWPIIHVSILLITGFTQASHIVRFFKSRRII